MKSEYPTITRAPHFYPDSLPLVTGPSGAGRSALFLDEATASLPEAHQNLLYALLRERLPRTRLVSIGHRASLAQFHARKFEWRVKQAAAGELVPVPAG